ncbi:MAG TPA: hypothetical protein VFP71_08710, partial [Candidatus Angelobacter sp.]|nr:hypothetical protein [Candidatus Angelobacter sp.]
MMAMYRIQPAHPRSCPVEFGDANFWSGKPSFEMALKNLTPKPIQQIELESDVVVGLNHLTNAPGSWKITLPVNPQQNTLITMPNQMAHYESILGWVVSPQSLTFADGSRWSPQERGECMKIYWRDKNHQDMQILPPSEMP